MLKKNQELIQIKNAKKQTQLTNQMLEKQNSQLIKDFINDSGLKCLFSGKKQKLNVNGITYHQFTPDITPLEHLISLPHLNLREIDMKLQKDRLDIRMKETSDFKAQLSLSERCPKCTLKPPCKHFQSSNQFFQKNTQLFKKEEWLMMSQISRDNLIREKRKAQQILEQQLEFKNLMSKSPEKQIKSQFRESSTIKTLLMLKLNVNEKKQKAMVELGKKPLKIQDRQHIELKKQLSVGDKLFNFQDYVKRRSESADQQNNKRLIDVNNVRIRSQSPVDNDRDNLLSHVSKINTDINTKLRFKKALQFKINQRASIIYGDQKKERNEIDNLILQYKKAKLKELQLENGIYNL